MNAALDLFASNGIAATSIDMLLVRTGASLGSLYHHFGSKDGLAAAVYLQGIEAYFQAAQQLFSAATTTEDKVKALVRAFVDRVVADPTMARFLIEARPYLRQSGYAEAIEHKNKEFLPDIAAWIREGMARGELRRLPPESMLPILSGPARDYARQWLNGRVTLPIAHVREVLAQAAWDALRPDGHGTKRRTGVTGKSSR